jgi:sodium/potassium-transporting ATPase subunit alpha
MITGESEPICSSVEAHDPNALEAKNIIFNGSLVVDGGCLAVVIRTGDATLIGTMVELTSDVGKAASTFKVDIDYFVKIVTVLALCQAATIFIVGLSRGINPVDVFINGFVTIMIGNVPQGRYRPLSLLEALIFSYLRSFPSIEFFFLFDFPGLPTTVTACLYLIADGMTKQNVFVKKLDIIESLGCCTCICTDKTGTLTMNKMSVANTWVLNKELSEVDFEKIASTNSSSLGIQHKKLMEIAILNSRVVLERKEENGPLVPTSDATELGFYNFFSKLTSYVLGEKENIENFRANHSKIYEIPFNSAFKWQMTIHKLESENGKQFLLLKGNNFPILI